MRYLTWLLLSLIPTVALAQAELTVTIPAEAITVSSAQCDRQRVVLKVRAADWNNDVCATIMTRLGLRTSLEQEQNANKQVLVTAAVSVGNNAAQSEMNDFDVEFPLPVTPAVCGDSITDTEFGEDCDDGGESATCNANCTTSVCGDGELNVTAGEQCDDLNTTPGDGCDASCLIE